MCIGAKIRPRMFVTYPTDLVPLKDCVTEVGVGVVAELVSLRRGLLRHVELGLQWKLITTMSLLFQWVGLHV